MNSLSPVEWRGTPSITIPGREPEEKVEVGVSVGPRVACGAWVNFPFVEVKESVSLSVGDKWVYYEGRLREWVDVIGELRAQEEGQRGMRLGIIRVGEEFDEEIGLRECGVDDLNEEDLEAIKSGEFVVSRRHEGWGEVGKEYRCIYLGARGVDEVWGLYGRRVGTFPQLTSVRKKG